MSCTDNLYMARRNGVFFKEDAVFSVRKSAGQSAKCNDCRRLHMPAGGTYYRQKPHMRGADWLSQQGLIQQRQVQKDNNQADQDKDAFHAQRIGKFPHYLMR